MCRTSEPVQNVTANGMNICIQHTLKGEENSLWQLGGLKDTTPSGLLSPITAVTVTHQMAAASIIRLTMVILNGGSLLNQLMVYRKDIEKRTFPVSTTIQSRVILQGISD
jgi:hypothetical protein